ncbi:ROK family protein [Lignipirellula cremea]|uniref:Glucokinase n=1 Tax=Lignipirellula cremea TaxID=2528010 RepID=A0A518E2E2_9BACT|nr:ROK family protein [Lignipirellula cremea]QDU98268.1 Glucokinase [Lignipirellula cremea]
MFLGIEIGGTKLQLGVGQGDGSPPQAVIRRQVGPQFGAAGILHQIDSAAAELLAQHPCQAIGIGFGGPVDRPQGRVFKSHQIAGWDQFELAAWGRQVFQLPTVIANDCDAAALAEARFGAGRSHRSVFYVTVGTGVGGGFVVDGQLFGQDRPAIAEIGHLRPGLQADRTDQTVESIASGWGIVAETHARLAGEVSPAFEMLHRTSGPDDPTALRRRFAEAIDANQEYTDDLLLRCQNDPEKLTAKTIAAAAADGNEIAREVIDHACRALGWGIAQVTTLLSPDMVVIGGGVSLIGETLFFSTVRHYAQLYGFPPLAGTCAIEPASLGELTVVHGALALAAESV